MLSRLGSLAAFAVILGGAENPPGGILGANQFVEVGIDVSNLIPMPTISE